MALSAVRLTNKECHDTQEKEKNENAEPQLHIKTGNAGVKPL